MALTQMELLYGPIMLGISLNILLFGIMTTQTYYYFVHYKRDKLWMRCFVMLLFCSDTVNTAFDMVFMYQRLIVFTNDQVVMNKADWIFNTDPALTAIIAFFVQSFFAWRVKVITGSIFLSLSILFFSCAQLLGGLATAIACGIVQEFAQFHKFKVVVIIWLACAAVADVVIAIALVTHLRAKRTGFITTDDIITKITRMAVSTGAITALCAIIDLIAFLVSTSGLHLAFNYPLAKLYTNSLLSSLNARPVGGAYSDPPNERSQGRSFGGLTGRGQGDNGGLRRGDILELHGTKTTGAVNVTVSRTVEMDSDPGMHKPKMFDADSNEMDDSSFLPA